MIVTSKYLFFKNFKEKDDQIFYTEIDQILIFGVADGVSNCSKGRVASATVCFALSKYFNEHPIDEDLNEYALSAIKYAVEELQEVEALFNEHYKSVFLNIGLAQEKGDNIDSHALTTEGTLKNQEVEIKESENQNTLLSSSLDEQQKEDIILRSRELRNPTSSINKKTIKPKARVEGEKGGATNLNELELKLEEIFSYLKQFNKEEYENGADYIMTILKEVKRMEDGKFDFQTTLSLNFLRNLNERVELNSYNFGDSELIVISVNPLTLSIESQISHYGLHQGNLKSFISSNKGQNGRLDISSRNLYENDLLFVGSDGTYFSKTSKTSGNPFSPLHNLIIKCLRSKLIPQLPILWFEKLSSMNALDDDFSMFLIECARSAEGETENVTEFNPHQNAI